MSRGETATVQIPADAAPSVGAVTKVRDLADMTIQFVHGTTSSGAAQLQGSLDSENWFDVGPALAGGASQAFDVSLKSIPFLRVSKGTDFDNDSARVIVAGFNTND